MQDQMLWNWARRNTTPADGQLRVSDADRAEVTEALAKHYADGRLDQAEMQERVAQALAAKTRIELTATLADLPWSGPPEPDPPKVRRRPPLLLMFLALFIAFGALVRFSTQYGPWRPHIPVLAIILIVVLLTRRHDHHRRALGFTQRHF
jgi:hypothetical protein